MLLFLSTLLWFRRTRSVGSVSSHAVAVLPFQNVSGDPANDYLRFAIADGVRHCVDVRSVTGGAAGNFNGTIRGPNVDPQKAGKALHAGMVVTGHFVQQGENLIVTLQAIEVLSNRMLWQGTPAYPRAI